MADLSSRITKLSAGKQELLRRVMTRAGLEPSELAIPKRPDDPRALPLSRAQEAVWFVDQLADGDGALNLPSAVRLRGPLNVEALRAAGGYISQAARDLGKAR